MPSNIEIKARINGDARSVRARARKLATQAPTIMRQEDTFFVTPRGRLKLRVPDHGVAELIYYERADEIGPRSSTYAVAAVEDPSALKEVLTACLGIRGVVRKERELFLAGDTRIHVDDVEGLGLFLELEVALPGEDRREAVRRRCRELMDALGVGDEDLVDRAYIDLLIARG